jgi:hypothetical protein
MHLTPQKERAAALSQFAALSIDTLPTADSRDLDDSADDTRLLALRRSFEPFGLSVYRLLGNELAVTGAGLSRSLPDHRCAWVLLRHLKAGTS